MVTTVAETLRQMGRLGWTVATVAEGLGVSRQSVNRWWRGAEPEAAQMALLALRSLKRRKTPPAARRGPKPKTR